MRIPALIQAFLLPGAQLYLCNRCRFTRCQVRRLLSRPNGIRHSIVTRERTGSFVSQYSCNECLAGPDPQTRVRGSEKPACHNLPKISEEERAVALRHTGLCSDLIPGERGSYSAARALRIPSFSMRTCNVLRFSPRSTAAPLGPPTTQSVASRVSRTCRRSTSSRVSILRGFPLPGAFAGTTGCAWDRQLPNRLPQEC